MVVLGRSGNPSQEENRRGCRGRPVSHTRPRPHAQLGVPLTSIWRRYVWKAVPPTADFVALGMLATNTPDEPPLDGMRCCYRVSQVPSPNAAIQAVPLMESELARAGMVDKVARYAIIDLVRCGHRWQEGLHLGGQQGGSISQFENETTCRLAFCCCCSDGLASRC